MTKERYITKAHAHINLYNTLIVAAEECKKVINEFNGKVLNIRLTKAMQANCTNSNISFGIDDNKKIAIKNFHQRGYRLAGGSTDYVNWYDLLFHVSLDDNGRIVAVDTMPLLDKSIAQVQVALDSFQRGIDEYDNHAKALKDLRKAVEDYQGKWPSTISARVEILNPRS